MLLPALRIGKSSSFLRSLTEHLIQNISKRSISSSKSLDKKYEETPPEDPIKRIVHTFRTLGSQLKAKLEDPDDEYPELVKKKHYFPPHTDILVIGAGAMGCSVAYWLKETVGDALSVVVVDKDFSVMEDVSRLSEYEKASTVLSVGGIRQQFSLRENIEMSLFGAEFLQNIQHYLSVPDEYVPNIQFQPDGYLFLASEKGAQTLKENSNLQRELGAKNELLSPKSLKKKFPWINTDGIALACHGLRNEGWFDPWTLLQAFKTKATYLGAKFFQGEVIRFTHDEEVEGSCVHTGDKFPMLDKALIRVGPDEVKEIQFAICIICAGPYSGKVAELAGVGKGRGLRAFGLPIEPRKRYVFAFHCPDGPGINCPLTVDPSGVYFRREGFGKCYLAGLSPEPHEEPSPDNLEVDHSWFDEKIWPVIARRASCFENLKVQNAWAGYYETNTFDENGIVGMLPTYSNLYIAAGFSGHGIQQAPAVGRAIMEQIIFKKYTTIDLTRLDPLRLMRNEPVYEKNIV